MKTIRRATRKDAQEITELRIKEFSRSPNFTLLEPQKLIWNQVDDTHEVVSIWEEGGLLISTMRFITLDDNPTAQSILEANLPGAIKFPALAFTSAATRKSHCGMGLNQLLRYYGIQAAKNHGIQSLLSPVYSGAPRLGFMEKLGYECHTLARTWQTKLAPNSPRILCVLKADQFNRALTILEEWAGNLIESYPWQGDPIRLKIRTPATL